MTLGRRLLVLCTVMFLVVPVAGLIDAGARSARAAPCHKCGTFRFKGKHALFAHHYLCSRAKRKARYVLAHRHAPPHWKCSLAELASGFAACHRNGRSREFVPA
jgi:hypothetical protein